MSRETIPDYKRGGRSINKDISVYRASIFYPTLSSLHRFFEQRVFGPVPITVGRHQEDTTLAISLRFVGNNVEKKKDESLARESFVLGVEEGTRRGVGRISRPWHRFELIIS